MFMRTSKAAFFLPLALTLAGCNSGDDLSQAEREAAEQAVQAGKVECALAGSDSFERVCTTEQIVSDEGKILVIRHPDGGFRRFDILTDGRGLAPADGFDETRITLMDEGMIEVRSGDDKYRLPAQIKGAEAVQDKDAS
jgi:hypothetical protein